MSKPGNNPKRKPGPATPEGRARAMANLKPYPKGTSGHPQGRSSAGATLREQLNSFAARGLTAVQLRKIARDESEPWTRRAAAERALRSLESPDLADFESLLKGEATLGQLREQGVNTAAIKKIKRRTRTSKDGEVEEEHELELHGDRGGVDFDRVADRTDGKPRQAVDLNGSGLPAAVKILIAGRTADVTGG